MWRYGPALVLLGAGTLVSSQAAPAPAAPLYRVEVVVFRAAAALGSAENWAEESSAAGIAPAAQPMDEASDADDGASGAEPAAAAPSVGPAKAASTGPTGPSPAAERSALDVLPASDYALDGTAESLRRSGRYVLVAHAAWTQLASPWGRPIEIPIASLGIEAPGLDGAIALERGEFLHLAVRLRYAESDPPPALGATPGTVFVLDQVHRVRFNERNYFDHPAFGVIALVTPVKAPAAAPR
jgi:Peptidoglycan-binding protein, CsiV